MTNYGKGIINWVLECESIPALVAEHGSIAAYARSVWHAPARLAEIVEAHLLDMAA